MSEFESRKVVMELYQQTALAKIPSSVEYIKEMLKQVTAVFNKRAVRKLFNNGFSDKLML